MDIQKVLVANRGEIAIRIFRACVEIGLSTVALYTYEDRYSQHRFKADESYQIGPDDEPMKPYLDIEEIVNLAKKKGVDAIHPGYGFLSESSLFAQRCAEEGITFIGPSQDILDSTGDKEASKKVAERAGVSIIESNKKDLENVDVAKEEAGRIGYPVMLKAAYGGGGRGMRVIRDENELHHSFDMAASEAKNAFGDPTMFMEKFIEEPKHIEVQILGDQHGNVVHLFERDCSVQRKHQKVVEFAPSCGLEEEVREKLYEYALNIANELNYSNAGTVEFLLDKNGGVYFIEINPRIQVEHTVTEMITGIDLVKAQLFIAGGYRLSDKQIKIPSQEAIRATGYAVQCRITTEDPLNDFSPDYGTITTYRPADGFGIRLDVGSLYQGVKVSPFFDSLLVKVSAHSRTLDGACRRMNRALLEFRIRGVKHNLPFLGKIVTHPVFKEGKATVNFVEQHPELFDWDVSLDRATKTVNFLGDIIVNGNPEIEGKNHDINFRTPKVPPFRQYESYQPGTKDWLTEMGPEKFCSWLRQEHQIQYTDTTFRDAHQSLLATRVRTIDMLRVAESFAKNHPQTFSMEVWGGATFDVCMRFLYENPWSRLESLREAMPNILLQMLLRGSNAVGYTAYPDNLIEAFIEKSWEKGIDIFRIFDSLNWMPSMAPSIESVRKRTNAIAEGTICYTGDILDPNRSKYTLNYYLQLAKDLENAGAHMLAIKDMAGLLKPHAAEKLITSLRDTVKLPIHLHTHDTASIQTATYLKAVGANVDAMDVALGGLSGVTSQPNFNSVVEMLRGHERENPYDIKSLNKFSNYWEVMREYYYPFESDLKAGTAEVYNNEIPGGQYSNLLSQAKSLGLTEKFEQIKEVYAEVNEMFGDVIKVTPTSKVVGDMTLFMVSQGYTREDIFEKGDQISFPESVQSFFRGDLGQPPGGFPKELQKIVLKDEEPYEDRPNDRLPPVDIDKEYEAFKEQFETDFPRDLEFTDYLSWKMYPKVWEDLRKKQIEYDDMACIPTKNFFYGMQPNEETIVEIAPGKTILVKFLSLSEPDDEGNRTVFFQLNGQTRNVSITDRALGIEKKENPKCEAGNPKHMGSPVQGKLTKVLVEQGQEVKKNDPLFVIEAMKMETTVAAPEDATIESVMLAEDAMVESDDLVVKLA